MIKPSYSTYINYRLSWFGGSCNTFVYQDLVDFFFFNDPATTDIYPLSLHDALPICVLRRHSDGPRHVRLHPRRRHRRHNVERRSEEHTSELQSRRDLVCRLLLDKKKYRYRRAPGLVIQNGGSRRSTAKRSRRYAQESLLLLFFF